MRHATPGCAIQGPRGPESAQLLGSSCRGALPTRMWSHFWRCKKSGALPLCDPQSLISATCDPVARVLGCSRSDPQRPAAPANAQLGRDSLSSPSPRSPPAWLEAQAGERGVDKPPPAKKAAFSSNRRARNTRFGVMLSSCASSHRPNYGPPEQAPELKLSPLPRGMGSTLARTSPPPPSASALLLPG